MSTTRGPWRVSPREQWRNSRIGNIRNEKDVGGRINPGHGYRGIPHIKC
jgi:hypothetical protein